MTALVSRMRRARRTGCNHDCRGRHHVVRPVMFAEPEDLEADAVGELDLLQNIGEGLVDTATGSPVLLRIAPCFDKGVDAEFH